MKLIHSETAPDGSPLHFFLITRDDTTGYIVIIDGDNLKMNHTVCCWGDPPTKQIFQGVLENRGSLERIVMCSREGGSHTLFGANASLSNLKDDEVAEIRKYLEEQLPNIRRIITEDREKQVKARTKKKRTSEALRLLTDFRYGDAKTHCEIHGLNYDELLQASIK